MGPVADDLIARIAEEEARLTALGHEQEAARGRLHTLRQRLAEVSRDQVIGSRPATAGVLTPSTSVEKVRLFRTLFRGREDVFPRLWVNHKKGTRGYAPTCTNEWVRGICEKPRVKCGECPDRAFSAVDDQVIVDHLQGRRVVGVYPLLPDETCWFLAADFDKTTWRDDITAFHETCRALRVPVAIERSRSGNGAHAWFFFTAPVAASVARQMGCYLITETMARRHQLGMQSYDRLFPNQDTMPRGGFGNLIALPLQREARERGNTVFLDDQFAPHADQWLFLASLTRMEPAAVEALARAAARRGEVIGVRFAEFADDEDGAPWEHLPSGRSRSTPIPGPLPAQVRAVLAQRLFIEKADLPSALLNRIKRLAAFQNPEFYKKQGMRLSTALTPRVIACAEELPQHIALPRGCRTDLEALLKEHGIALVVEDQRCAGEPVRFTFQGELTPIQVQAARALLKHDIGIFVAPPGIGKTVLGTYLVAQRARSTLILVHRTPLLDQWVAQISMFLGIEEGAIGRIGGGKHRPNGRLDVAMIQSLVRNGQVSDLVAGYGHVIVDECHHVPAVSFERVLAEIRTRYVAGLTATPHRRDGHHPLLEMQLGPVRFAVNPKNQAARRPFEHRLIVRPTAFRFDETPASAGIQALYRALARDQARNRLILDDIVQTIEEGRSGILLTERRDHLEYLATQMHDHAHHLVVLHGGMTATERRTLDTRSADGPRFVLATGRYIGEGFDDARLDTLLLAMPVAWKGTLVQYAGRLHRLHTGKTETRILDYVDREVPVLMRMFEKRLRAYRAIGYARDETPLGCFEQTDEIISVDSDGARYDA